MTLEPHHVPALNVEDDAVPVIDGRRDGLGRYLPGQFKELAPIHLVQPGQVPSYTGGVYPAAQDMAYVPRFAGQDRRARERPEVSVSRRGRDFLLTIPGEPAGQVERHPMESGRHHQARPGRGIVRARRAARGQAGAGSPQTVRLDGCPPSVVPQGCLVQLRTHTEMNACTVWAIGVTYPLRDPTCGVVEGQTAAFAIEDTVLGSANITTTSWDRNARSGTELTDGRGA